MNAHERPAEKLIPREFTVKVTLPPEASALLQDLHNDRQIIGTGFAVALAILAVVALKYLLSGRSKV